MTVGKKRRIERSLSAYEADVVFVGLKIGIH